VSGVGWFQSCQKIVVRKPNKTSEIFNKISKCFEAAKLFLVHFFSCPQTLGFVLFGGLAWTCVFNSEMAFMAIAALSGTYALGALT